MLSGDIHPATQQRSLPIAYPARRTWKRISADRGMSVRISLADGPVLGDDARVAVDAVRAALRVTHTSRATDEITEAVGLK